MSQWNLDKTLANDCHVLGKLELSHLLLHKNASVPWFMLVPPVHQIELHELDSKIFKMLMDESVALGLFIKTHFRVDKVNTAAIGNVVSQLHLHVIGRQKNDPCWPGVVWGSLKSEDQYDPNTIVLLKKALSRELNLSD